MPGRSADGPIRHFTMQRSAQSLDAAMEGTMTAAEVHDLDPLETREWMDALSAIRGHRGDERAEFVVNAVVDAARRGGLGIQQSLTTPYCNTIPVHDQPALPGDRAMQHKLRSIISR